MTDHDLVAFASGLSAKLATRSRHVCAFLGAGTSKACGLPDVATLQSQIVHALDEPQKSAFRQQLAGRNLDLPRFGGHGVTRRLGAVLP
jgi:hypothetical protein